MSYLAMKKYGGAPNAYWKMKKPIWKGYISIISTIWYSGKGKTKTKKVTGCQEVEGGEQDKEEGD